MYWLVSLPLGDQQPDRVWSRVQELTTYAQDLSTNWKFKLPENLRVGTLDSLMALSDDLIKVNAAVEGTVNKIRRQLYDLQSTLPEEERVEVTVEGTPPEGYLQHFAWNEAKYPSRRPPKDTITAIMDTVQKLDDDLKARSTEYSQSRSALQAMLRKRTGSLAVRDLSDAVPTQLLVSTEHLTTLVAVVPKAARNEWLSSYEALTEYIVPRSSTQIAEDSDYLAFTVVLFRRVVDDFKLAARSRGFQAKELPAAAEPPSSSTADDTTATSSEGPTHGASNSKPSAAAVASEDGGPSAMDRLRSDMESKRTSLAQWCVASYGEAFSSWIHVTAVRLFAESILRYGLPPQFLPVLMKPNARYVSQLRKTLAANFAEVGGQHYGGDVGNSSAGGAGEDLYPYVSFTLSIEEA